MKIQPEHYAHLETTICTFDPPTIGGIMSDFALNTKEPKTRRGCIQQYNIIINRCRLDFKGGTQFGIDMPTIRVTFPERYARLIHLKQLFSTLPE